jgi:hypothetical protein
MKRLIEVALPIREISAESVRDKSIRHGHISTLHLWWARRPLSACRAIVFSSLVPDPDDPDCPAEFRDAVVRQLDIYPQSCTFGYCVERRLDSPREMNVIIPPGRVENGKEIFTKAEVSGSVGVAKR